jgi:tetratricopeptide (TPR) repeat protein
VDISSQERRAQTFALLRQIILHASQRRPLVLAVENLHWSDPTSEEWLTALAAQLGGTAILLLATYRPGYRLPWLAHSWATQVALPPLNPHDSLAVVQAVPHAAQLPVCQHQAIVTQAAGNPFFLEELTWAAVEPGTHARNRPLPDTIQAVLGARLDHLPQEAKRLVQIAAVIGPEVPMPLLERVVGLAEDVLQRSLAHLQGAELLYEMQLFPDPVYTFKHALTHLRAAEALAVGLADHRRLGIIYRSLANTLRLMQDYEPALAYSQRAHAMATALGDVGLQMESRLAMGWTYCDLGDYRQAMEHFRQALTILTAAWDASTAV